MARFEEGVMEPRVKREGTAPVDPIAVKMYARSGVYLSTLARQ